MEIYVENLERQAVYSKEKAIVEAEKALKATGVINQDGTSKKQIVSRW